MNRLDDIIKQRVLILDGAMGTMIGNVMGKVGNSDELNLTRQDVVADIHRKYLDAGADIITTNTFSSQRISQADYNLQDKAWEIWLKIDNTPYCYYLFRYDNAVIEC